MVAESVIGLILTALATGIVFARFSQTTGQLVFSDKATISPMDGVPTLAFRVGNDRASTIFEATVRVGVIRTVHTAEGVLFYRLYDARLTRDRTSALARSWTVMHPIDEASPLFGRTPEECVKDEVEITVSVVGTDDISLQPVNARIRYTMKDVLWGARHADILRELPDGRIEIDVRKFDRVEPTAPTATFPYPKVR
jgi:inward rectifier potassium channel